MVGAIALSVASVALVVGLRFWLTADLVASLRQLESEIATQIRATDDPAGIQLRAGDEQVVQVIGSSGRILAASPDGASEPAIPSARRGTEPVEVTLVVDGEAGPYVALGSIVTTATGDPVTLIVARPMDDVIETIQALAGLLWWGVPILLVVVGMSTWWVVGHALRPVDSMRREVDAIGTSALDRRVQVPGTGDEIARLASTMNRMLDRLEDARQRERRFVSDASHELRSPVASIRQHAEVAAAHPEAVSSGDLAETVLAEGLRLQHLVDGLLLLARADEQAIRVDATPVDLDDIVLDAVRRLRSDPRLSVDGTGISAARVRGQRALLVRLVDNLTDNASRFARSRVAVALSADGAGWAVLRVEDDGPGIAAPDRERVFERFVRLDEGRAQGAGGSGLGLAIAREVAMGHGGSITITGSSLGGARFEVRLPTSAG
ncbi:MAG: HAMP domain-containing sensor histidine kinase [Candidatus Limnocylindrales bacterium]